MNLRFRTNPHGREFQAPIVRQEMSRVPDLVVIVNLSESPFSRISELVFATTVWVIPIGGTESAARNRGWFPETAGNAWEMLGKCLGNAVFGMPEPKIVGIATMEISGGSVAIFLPGWDWARQGLAAACTWGWGIIGKMPICLNFAKVASVFTVEMDREGIQLKTQLSSFLKMMIIER